MAASLLSHYRVLVAPGLHGSGPEHWQSRWQRLYPSFQRVEQKKWDDPHLPTWGARLDEVRAEQARPTLIVAHSFGSLTTAYSLARKPHLIAGVLLVAPADPEKFGVTHLLPHEKLPCPSIMIASTNDPWMSAARAALWAKRWGSEFIDGGALGHINSESGLGDWIFGQRHLQILAERAHNERLLSV